MNLNRTASQLLMLLVCSALIYLQLSLEPALADSHGDVAQSSIQRIESRQFGIDAAELAEIRQRMQAAVDGEFIPGALLLVGNSNGVGVLEAVGTRAPGANEPVDEDTIFRIYSMTKPIISVAIMTMVEDGLIALDDPVAKFIPEFSNLQLMQTDGETRPAREVMTIEHLLTHKSGLIQDIFARGTELGQRYASALAGDHSAREFAARIGQLPVLFEPGSAWHYGHSTDVLGAVLEVAASKPLDEVLRERIFDPLGMDETWFWVPEGNARRIAEPYYGEMTDNTVPRRMLSGGGGLNSTTEDYVRFAAMLLNGGSYRGVRVIETETLQQMREKKIGNSVSREYFFYGDTGDWGLGFHLQPTTDDADGPHNFGWRGIGGTIFIVDEENDFFMIYTEQKRGGPRAPFNNNIAQQVVYAAMRDELLQ